MGVHLSSISFFSILLFSIIQRLYRGRARAMCNWIQLKCTNSVQCTGLHVGNFTVINLLMMVDFIFRSF